MSDDDKTNGESATHERVWEKLYDATVAFLGAFGRRDGYEGSRFVRGDFDVIDDDWGWDIVKAELNFELIRPEVVKGLQAILINFPGWMISVRATFPKDASDPGMGVFIYFDRVVDDLKRDYLPPEFVNMRFD